MIVLRGLQGFFGGVLIPLAFTIIVSMLPPSKRPMGFAGFAITATFAPAIGPTIGGWLTDNYGWPTIFYMNLVPGAVMLAALIYALPRSQPQLGLLRQGDWLGIALMAVGLAALADRAGRRQRVRLVRLALHRQAEPGRGAWRWALSSSSSWSASSR